jgi:hypothetical protein
MKKEFGTLLAAAAFAVTAAVPAQAADIAPVTGHWTKLGADRSAFAGEAPVRMLLSHAGDHLHIAEPNAAVSAR